MTIPPWWVAPLLLLYWLPSLLALVGGSKRLHDVVMWNFATAWTGIFWLILLHWVWDELNPAR